MTDNVQTDALIDLNRVGSGMKDFSGAGSSRVIEQHGINQTLKNRSLAGPPSNSVSATHFSFFPSALVSATHIFFH